MKYLNFNVNELLHVVAILLWFSFTSCYIITLMIPVNFMTYHDFDGH